MQPTILGGPIGTALQAQGMPSGVCPEQWTIEHPEALRAIQHGYINAGAQRIAAPTFGANAIRLGEYGLQDNVAEINKQLVAMTKQNVSNDTLIAGNMASLGLFTPPYGDTAFDELIALYTTQARALHEAGVDYFYVETLTDVVEMRAAILAIQDVSDKPIFVSFTCNQKGKTLSGSDIEAALMIAQSMSVQAFGLNCIALDPLPLFARLRSYAEVPLLYLPNAGLPDGDGNYHITPEELTHHHRELATLGVQYFGVCCGGTAKHIAGIAKNLKGTKVAPPAPLHDSITADNRGVYSVDAPDGDNFTVNNQVDLATLLEEQFFWQAPVRLNAAPEWYDVVKRAYHGIPRWT
ncbi:MAG: homocysteine S-methyltransferase family protein [Oscillospiraceae bacterium]|nr:homocysteine S-methyltransferase family protein [Oscillospiraceae bacterium]